MKLKILFLTLLAVYGQSTATIIRTRENIESLSAEHVEYINQLNTTWRAAHNFKGYKIHELKGLCGTILENEDEVKLTNFDYDFDIEAFPKDFDSRKKWPECADVISHIRDQGSCGSCWAVAAASGITDRVCIASGGKNKTQLSAQTITSCCKDCFRTEGCQGGYPIMAWLHWTRVGLPTGGDFGDKETCAPYLVPPCEHHVNGSRPKCGDIVKTPECTNKCTNEQIDYESDKNYGKSAFRSSFSVGEIKTELMKRGPMTASFVVYDDFFLYKEGVYQVTEGAKEVGGHAIVVIGFGTTEDGTQYWLAKNNWNTDWGDNGYFKIKMGQAGINRGFVSGIARKSKKQQ